MPVWIIAKALERGVQATEVEALRTVGEPEVLLECLAPGRVLALFAHPVLEQGFAGELKQGRAVARHVQQGQIAAGVVDVQQVGCRVAIDAQRAHPYLAASRHHASGSPCQLPGGIAQAALADLGVAGGDEIELAG
ncbi:hypothetical protein D3C80_1607730 [compost metagenome]